MRRGGGDHGLHGVVVGTALVLFGVVLYYILIDVLSRRGGPMAGTGAAPAPAPSQALPEGQVPGASRTLESVPSIPPLLIQRTGRPTHQTSGREPPPPTPPDQRRKP